MKNKVTEHFDKDNTLMSVSHESEFSKEIKKIFKEYHPQKILETGTYLGMGTTRSIYDAIQEAEIKDVNFHTVEVNPEFYQQALANVFDYDQTGTVIVHNGLSVPRNLLPSKEEIETITIKAIEDEEIFVDHDEIDRVKKYYDETNFSIVEDDLIGKILKEFNYEPDFVLLDSAGHMGKIEFDYTISLIKKKCIIALDDVNHVKHYQSLKLIKSDERFEILHESDEKFGFVIVSFTPAENEVKIPNPAKAEFPQNTIAIGRVEHIGDIIACEPVARYLKKENPEAYLVWVVNEQYADIFEANPYIDEVYTVKCLTEWLYLRDSGIFKQTYDLHLPDRVCPSCLIKLPKENDSSGVKLSNYFNYGGLLQAFSLTAGLPPLTDAPQLYIPETIKIEIDNYNLPSEYVVMHCKSNESVKNWNDEKWIELAKKIQTEFGLDIVEIGLNSVLQKSDEIEFTNLCGQLTVNETAEVIRRAKVFIGIDSMGGHIANAAEVFGIILMGSYKNFRIYNPYSGKYGKGENCILLDSPTGNVKHITVENVLGEFEKALLTVSGSNKELEYHPKRKFEDKIKNFLAEKDFRYLTVYLPQYHPIPENDEWWGKGFTEWSNVAKAKPLFPGHYQPHVPSELGFYDLRLDEVRKEQAKLASEYAIEGFIYYQYWFNGKLLLEKPLEMLHANPTIDKKFCVAWANENWTKRWDGKEKEILQEQTYGGLKDAVNHFFYMLPFFNDNRYIRIEGKPVYLIYRPMQIPKVEEFIEIWNKLAKTAGLGGIYFIAMKSAFEQLPKNFWREKGFNNELVFQPGTGKINKLNVWKELNEFGADEHVNTQAIVVDYEKASNLMMHEITEKDDVFGVVIPSWDNTPRRAKVGAYILKNSTPEKFGKWLEYETERILNREKDKRLLIINAWNEWAEGNHLEPDFKWGRGYLRETYLQFARGHFKLARRFLLNGNFEKAREVLIRGFLHLSRIKAAIIHAVNSGVPEIETHLDKDFANFHFLAAVIFPEKAEFHIKKSLKHNPAFIPSVLLAYPAFLKANERQLLERMFFKFATLNFGKFEKSFGDFFKKTGAENESEYFYRQHLNVFDGQEETITFEKEDSQILEITVNSYGENYFSQIVNNYETAQKWLEAEKLVKKGLTDKAKELLLEILGTNDSIPEIFISLAELLKKDLPSEALILLQKALAIDPTNYSARKKITEVYFNLQDYRNAAVNIRKLLDEIPTDTELLRLMAEIQILAEQYDEAVKFLKIILHHEPGNEYAKQRMVEINQEKALLA